MGLDRGFVTPFLFNLYMKDLSMLLKKLPIGCCSGDTIINYLIYADDIAQLAPSAKRLQRLLDLSYKYACDNDIQ